MPGKNTTKEYGAEQYYHIYSRGVARGLVFRDEQDYGYFLSLFKRYLSATPSSKPKGAPYPHYANRIKLLAYCLMPTHIHILIYQHDQDAMKELMKSLITSYGMYFNKKYKRVGPVFQSRYKASRIDKDNYLDHISRYIHLNPKDWQDYPYSSMKYYMDKANAEWINPVPILELFPSRAQYLEFLKDYDGYKDMLDELSWELADT